jgi:hypothetical protein
LPDNNLLAPDSGISMTKFGLLGLTDDRFVVS